MSNEDKKNRLKLLFVAGALVLLLFVMAGMVFGKWVGGGEDLPRLRVGNWNDLLDKIPDFSRKRIEEGLYDQVSINSADNNVPSSGARIRVGTERLLETEIGITAGSFIVDIPKIEQSYVVQYFYSNGTSEVYMEFNNGQEIEGADSVTILCVTNPSDIIYPNFVCNDGGDGIGYDVAESVFYMTFLAPQAEFLVDGKEAALRFEYNKIDAPQLDVIVDNCNDNDIFKKAEEAARMWVEEAGFDPDMFTYHVPIKYDYCMIR